MESVLLIHTIAVLVYVYVLREFCLQVSVGIFKDFYGVDHSSQSKMDDNGKVRYLFLKRKFVN